MIRSPTTWTPHQDSNPKISVIIPTKNRAEMLCDAIKSLNAQTVPPQEIIIIDDHSEDNTCQKLQQFKHLKVIHAQKHGVSHARNLGLQHASNPWIAFLDSDDLWTKNKLAAQIQCIKDNPHAPLIHCNEKWLLKGKHLNQKKHHRKSGGDIFAECLQRCMVSPSASIIHRDFLKDLGGFDPVFTVCEDFELWLHITAHHPVAFVDEALVIKQGGHPDQLSKKYLGMEMWRILAILQLLQSNTLAAEKTVLANHVLQQKISHTKIGMLKHKRIKLLNLLEIMADTQKEIAQYSLNKSASTKDKNLARLSESLKLEMESIAVTA